MKKLLCFLVVLMTFTIAWPHAPPVVVDPGITVEFVADAITIDCDITVTYDYILLDQVALPFVGDNLGSPEVTAIANPGTLDVSYNYANFENATQDATATNNYLLKIANTEYWQCSSENRLHLATNENTPYNVTRGAFVERGCL